MAITVRAILTVLFLVFTMPLTAQPANPLEGLARLSDLSIDMQWFLSYQLGESNDAEFNRFALKRGYVNIKKGINKTFSGRITTDITTDREGDGEGDIEMRLKYLYLKTQMPSFGPFHKPYLEFGLVHTPWIDFEQAINRYRVQGSMFLDRNDMVSSADFGVVFMSLFGGTMDKKYTETVNGKYPGRYGSMSVGIFNGGGYHALEYNNNKAVEGRVTIRPIPDRVPGLQVTGHGAIGKGNIAASPDWRYGSAYLSYEHARLVLTGELFHADGNFEGTALRNDPAGDALPQRGYSLFGELRLLDRRISLVGRYDVFTREFGMGDVDDTRTIAGIAWHFVSRSKLFLNIDRLDRGTPGAFDPWVAELALELIM